MEVLGRIKMVGPAQDVSPTFRKRELVVTTEEQYPQHILIEFTQDKCDLLNAFQPGEQVRVGINLRGREWVNPQGETRYFNSIQGWRIDRPQAHNNHTISHNKAMVLHKAVMVNHSKVLDNNLLNKATVSQIRLKTKAVVMRIITIQASLLLRILIKIKKQKTICLFNIERKNIILNPDYICNRDFLIYNHIEV